MHEQNAESCAWMCSFDFICEIFIFIYKLLVVGYLIITFVCAVVLVNYSYVFLHIPFDSIFGKEHF